MQQKKSGKDFLFGNFDWTNFKIEGGEKLLGRKLSEAERLILIVPVGEEQGRELSDDEKRLCDFKLGCRLTMDRYGC